MSAGSSSPETASDAIGEPVCERPSGHHPVVHRLHRLPRSFSLLEINRRFQTPHGRAGPIALYFIIFLLSASSVPPAFSLDLFAYAFPGFVYVLRSDYPTSYLLSLFLFSSSFFFFF